MRYPPSEAGNRIGISSRIKGHLFPGHRLCPRTLGCCGTHIFDDHNHPSTCLGRKKKLFHIPMSPAVNFPFRLPIPQHCNVCISKLCISRWQSVTSWAVERSGNSDVENTAFLGPRGGYLHFKFAENQHIARGVFCRFLDFICDKLLLIRGCVASQDKEAPVHTC